jgi:hypothetical protein
MSQVRKSGKNPGYTASLEQRAASAGVTYEQRRAEETSNVPLRKYGTPEEVAARSRDCLRSLNT